MHRLVYAVYILAMTPILSAQGQDSVAISDFRYPETKAVDWKGGLSGYVQGTSNSTETAPPYVSVGRSGSSDYVNLNSTFLYFHSKEDHVQDVSLSGSGYFTENGSSTDIYDTTGHNHLEDKRSGWNTYLRASWTYLHYLQSDGFHFIGSVLATYTRDYSRSDYSSMGSTTPSSSEYISRGYDVEFRGSLGVGYGRMRDGTFVARALRIIQRLREDGVITAPLRRDQILAVVDRVAHIREYTTNYERYTKDLVQDIVNELVASGIVAPPSVNAYSTLRITEAFNENILSRFFGWRVYYAFEDSHTQSLQEIQDYENSFPRQGMHLIDNEWEYLHEFGAEIGHPLSLETHLHSQARLELPVHAPDTRYQMSFQASLIHQVGERVACSASYQYSRDASDAYLLKWGAYSVETDHTIQGNFVYFVEDQVQFDIGLEYDWRSSIAYPGFAFPGFLQNFRHSSESGFVLSFGFKYNII